MNNITSNISDWAVFALTSLILVLPYIILWCFKNKKKDSFKTFSADPNTYGSLSIALTMLGTVVGGGMFLAVGQIGYEAGVVGYIMGFATLLGLFWAGAMASLIKKTMNEAKVNTILELLTLRYSSRVGILFSVVNCCIYFFLLAGQFVAIFNFGAFMFEAKVISSWVPIGIGLVFFCSLIGYFRFGGYKKIS